MSTAAAPQYEGCHRRSLEGRPFDRVVEAYLARLDAIDGCTCTKPRHRGARGAGGWEPEIAFEVPASAYETVRAAIEEFQLDATTLSVKERAWVGQQDQLRVETKIKTPVLSLRVTHQYTPDARRDELEVRTKAFFAPGKQLATGFDAAFGIYRGKFERDLRSEIEGQQTQEAALMRV